uniref:Uncharacterized protein n=1 Tax=Rhizophora mucronata TaxID=61149 RepID=A0A2P2KNI7_RHIMU
MLLGLFALTTTVSCLRNTLRSTLSLVETLLMSRVASGLFSGPFSFLLGFGCPFAVFCIGFVVQ